MRTQRQAGLIMSLFLNSMVAVYTFLVYSSDYILKILKLSVPGVEKQKRRGA